MTAGGARPSRKRVTMRDVATFAGVGLTTVSRVVNGVLVDPVLTAQVRDAVEQLGYRHDATASNLRRTDRRTDTVGLVLEDVANPFSSSLHRAVEDVVAERGLLLLTGSSDEDPARERSLLTSLLTRRVDGLVVLPTGEVGAELASARQFGTPVVCVDRMLALDGVDTVTVDNAGGIAEAVQRLTSLGHRKIAFLGDRTSLWTAQQRWDGFVAAMTQARCAVRTSWARRDIHDAAAAESATTEIFTGRNSPTALITAQNLLTIGARRVLQKLQLHHSVAHVGFDDFEMADLLDPPLSVVAQDPAEIGRTAATMLLARLDGDSSPARHVVLPTRYLARGSGEIPGDLEIS
ncbi:LacI family DNA-binding transcriptional regulator [Streptomyces sp. NBC_01190]|uniref:LacI family DNA-binding transcriptional regulator n=1 Tax=Streptomyces sp. NBC_01190 TaxID=2903767 RepID=UPI003862F694|nr:LacI family transcriptional regulator [Streptomyces sp. NBC_01190]